MKQHFEKYVALNIGRITVRMFRVAPLPSGNSCDRLRTDEFGGVHMLKIKTNIELRVTDFSL